MDRRHFLTSSAAMAAGAVPLVAIASQSTVPVLTTLEHTKLYPAMFEWLGGYTSGQIQRLNLLALLYARQWLLDCGFTIEWVQEPPHLTCECCGTQHKLGTTYCCRDYRHERAAPPFDTYEVTWRCNASFKGSVVEWWGDEFEGEAELSRADASIAAEMAQIEGYIGLNLMHALASRGNRDDHGNFDFIEEDDGRIVTERY